MTRLVSLVVAVFVSLLPPVATLACSLSSPEPHTLDAVERGLDVKAPEAPMVTAEVLSIGGKGGGSCDDLGHIKLRVSAIDDRTPGERLGYSIEIVDGSPPAGFRPFSEPIRAYAGAMHIYWIDGGAYDSFDFTLGVTAIDLGGNRSAPTQVRIQETGCGCGTAGAGGPGGLVALLLLGLRAQRRPQQ